MKFTADTNELKEALQLLRPAYNNKSIMPVLDCVKISIGKKKAELTVTNLSITIATTIKVENSANGDLLVPYQKLKDILQLYGSAPVLVKLEGNQIQVSIGNDVFNLGKAENAVNFPIIPEVGGTPLQVPAQVMEAIRTAAASASTDNLRLQMCTVLLRIADKHLTVVSTDAHTLYLSGFDLEHMPADIAPADVLIPVGSIKALHDTQQCYLSHSDKNIKFTSEDTTVTIRRVDAKFPDYEAVIPTFVKNAEVDMSALVLGVTRALVTCNNVDNGVNIDVEPQRMLLHTRDVDFERSAAVVIDCAAELPAVLKIAFNGRYILRSVQQMNADGKASNLHLCLPANPARPMVIKKDGIENTLVLVMPIYREGE